MDKEKELEEVMDTFEVKKTKKDSYTNIENWVFDYLVLNESPKMYLLQMLRYAGNNAVAFPGMNALSKKLNIGKQKVIYLMKFWEWTKFVEVHRRKVASDENAVNIYIIDDANLENFCYKIEELNKKIRLYNKKKKKSDKIAEIAFNDFFEYMKNEKYFLYGKKGNKDIKPFKNIVEKIIKERLAKID